MPVALIVVLGALSSFAPLSIDMYLPALPELRDDLGTSAASVQLTLTAFVIGIAIGQLVAGPLSDTWGRRRPLLAGLVAYVATSALCAVAPSIEILIGLRLLQGIAGAAGIVIGAAIVRDLREGAEAARLFAALMLVNGVAPVLAPVLGGQLLRVTDWRGTFVVLTGIGMALTAATLAVVRETLPPEGRHGAGLGATWRTFGTLLRERAYVGYILCGAFGFSAMFAYIAGSSFVLQEIHGLSPQTYSLVFGANAVGLILGGQVTSRLVRRMPLRRLLGLGLTQTAVGGAAVLAVTVADLGLGALLPALFVTVSSVGIIFPTASALALSGDPSTAGSAAGLFGLAQFAVGGATAPLVGVAGSGTALPMAVTIAACGAAGLLSFALLARPGVGRPGADPGS